MTNAAWKWFERVVARWFGYEREPGSGAHRTEANQRTGTDSQHPRLGISCKHTNRKAVRQPAIVGEYQNALEIARKEDKTPLVCTKGRGMRGFLITVHCDDLLMVAAERKQAMLDHVPGGVEDDA